MNKKGQLHIFKVFFIALAFILIFSFLAGNITGSTEQFVTQWGDDYPMLAWLMAGMNFWIIIGALIGIIAMIVFGTGIAEE